MFTHPGKKLNFMGNDLALFDEWNENDKINFDILHFPIHDSFHKYFQNLSSLYKKETALYKDEYNYENFKWIMCDNPQNIFIYKRTYKNNELVIVLNFSNQSFEYFNFNINHSKGKYIEILNSDNFEFSGNNYINNYDIGINSSSIGIKIPALGAIILKYYK